MRGRLLPLYLVVFFGFFGYALMITVFTPLIMLEEGGLLAVSASKAERSIVLGLLLTLYPLGQFLGSPILGAIADRVGRKPVLVITLIVTAIAYGFVALSLHFLLFWILCIALLVAGFSESNIVAAQSAIADVAEKEHRTKLFGYIYVSASLSYVVGPLLGGKLAEFGYPAPFWLSAILVLCGALLVMALFRETLPKERRSQGSYLAAFRNLKGIFLSSHLRFYYWVNFILYLAIFGFFRSYPMYIVDQFGFGVSKTSEFIAWVAFPIILANVGLTSFFAKRYSPLRVTIVSAILMGLFLVVVVVPGREGWLWLTLFASALPVALCMPACASLLSFKASSESQGRVMGSNQSLAVAAEAISSLGSGLLAAALIRLPMIFWAACALTGAALLIRKRARGRSPSEA